jgi:secreted trypsin-like serine protease
MIRFVLLLVACLSALQTEARYVKGYNTIYVPLSVPTTHEALSDDEVVAMGRMINANRAAEGQFPWAARVTTRTPGGASACSGSVIGVHYTLSAYHCVSQPVVNAVEFEVGSVDRNSAVMERHFASGFWFVAPSANFNPDIALFRLTSPLTFRAGIQPIRLPSNDIEQHIDFASQIMGFGLNDAGVLSQFLMYGNFRISSNPSCGFRPFEICNLAFPNTATSTQGGDSGGPWIINQGGIPVQVGVHWGRRWNSTTNMHWGTRVSTFVDWIEDLSGIRY